MKLLLDPPNFLLMDEPTHLDMGSIDAVIAALSEFTGTLIFISHDDVYFLSVRWRPRSSVNAGALALCRGYDYYLEKSKAVNARAALDFRAAERAAAGGAKAVAAAAPAAKSIPAKAGHTIPAGTSGAKMPRRGVWCRRSGSSSRELKRTLPGWRSVKRPSPRNCSDRKPTRSRAAPWP